MMWSDVIWKKDTPEFSGYYACHCDDGQIRVLIYKSGVFYEGRNFENKNIYPKQKILGHIYLPDPKLLDSEFDVEIGVLRNLAYINNMGYVEFSKKVFGYLNNSYFHKPMPKKAVARLKRKMKKMGIRTNF